MLSVKRHTSAKYKLNTLTCLPPCITYKCHFINPLLYRSLTQAQNLLWDICTVPCPFCLSHVVISPNRAGNGLHSCCQPRNCLSYVLRKGLPRSPEQRSSPDHTISLLNGPCHSWETKTQSSLLLQLTPTSVTSSWCGTP